MKKILAVLLALLMVGAMTFALVGCGNDDDNDDDGGSLTDIFGVLEDDVADIFGN
ncbi:MAG: hypothetical protein FWE06_02640 [Oscillospiraceae bacterium]|nr:hypothetical protein [Oscillospiraceae bacterium]